MDKLKQLEQFDEERIEHPWDDTMWDTEFYDNMAYYNTDYGVSFYEGDWTGSHEVDCDWDFCDDNFDDIKIEENNV